MAGASTIVPCTIMMACAALPAIMRAQESRPARAESAPASRAAAAHAEAAPVGCIAFMRDGGVWIVAAAGGEPVCLVEDAGYDRPLVWTPDGRRLVFWKHTRGWDLLAVDVRTKAVTNLTKTGDDCRSASFSPDGSRMAFMKGGAGLWISGPGDAPARQLSQLGHRDDPAAWSPDGTRLVLTDLQSDGGAIAPALFLIDLEGGPARRLASGSEARFLPDGRRLVAVVSSGHRRDVAILDLEGRVLEWLDESPAYEHSLAVAPDGRSVAWIRGSERGDGIERYDLGEKKLVRIASMSGVRMTTLSFAPDSRHVVAGIEADGRGEAFIGARMGDEPWRGIGGARFPAWCPQVEPAVR
jgi:Tol biopolymer transport system component